MPYALAFGERPVRQLRELDVWLQEEVLDELEALASNPQRLIFRAISPGAVHDFTRRGPAGTYYLFLTVERDDQSQVIEVLDIGHHFRPTEQ
jgi:hypothetical protein